MRVERISDFVWEVPVGAVEGMRVPGRIFANSALIEKAVEDRAVEQVANVATLPGIVEASFAMPDIHWGYGFPVGGVAATDADNGGVISPGGVGFDICCGVRLLRSNLKVEAVRSSIRDLSKALAKQIPRGVGTKGVLRLSRDEMRSVLRDGALEILRRGIGRETDAEKLRGRRTPRRRRSRCGQRPSVRARDAAVRVPRGREPLPGAAGD